ncbi:hypothetical protein DPEC_G00209790 [Dallia pectoralis]|uniref:Uncharacterized protein n=1 Tax=Dallia pectoralis TaxID=75939 RepID=A0ACC2G5P6_DALPE|nr:hypothetical protein DPEC_G00209790 [Dallia pectoralis]
MGRQYFSVGLFVVRSIPGCPVDGPHDGPIVWHLGAVRWTLWGRRPGNWTGCHMGGADSSTGVGYKSSCTRKPWQLAAGQLYLSRERRAGRGQRELSLYLERCQAKFQVLNGCEHLRHCCAEAG